jgi:hypothetical protein
MDTPFYRGWFRIQLTYQIQRRLLSTGAMWMDKYDDVFINSLRIKRFFYSNKKFIARRDTFSQLCLREFTARDLRMDTDAMKTKKLLRSPLKATEC